MSNCGDAWIFSLQTNHTSLKSCDLFIPPALFIMSLISFHPLLFSSNSSSSSSQASVSFSLTECSRLFILVPQFLFCVCVCVFLFSSLLVFLWLILLGFPCVVRFISFLPLPSTLELRLFLSPVIFLRFFHIVVEHDSGEFFWRISSALLRPRFQNLALNDLYLC